MNGVEIKIEPATEPKGIRVVDPIQRHRYILKTPSRVPLREADAEPFNFPITTAVVFETSRMELPTLMSIMVRDHAGELIREIGRNDERRFEQGTYELELSGPIKMYLRVHSTVRISTDDTTVRLEFESPTRVRLGARSLHEQPATTIAVPPEPRHLLKAITAFGSGLKTQSCERSFPTLRGHPPLVERGETVDIPAELEVPDTGVELQVPPTFASAFVVAPLAYYLGADVVPGRPPLLRTDTGLCHQLDTACGFEREVERLLKQTFVLDCVTRTEGLYQVPLAERTALEQRLSLDFDDLYGRPLAEQLAAYLEVPFDEISRVCPEWKLTAHVVPRASHIETLPFVVNDLAVVRTSAPSTSAGAQTEVSSDPDTGTLEGFVRAGTSSANPDDVTLDETSERLVVHPETTSGIEHAWIGDAIPVGASRPTVKGFQHRLARNPEDGPIQVTVVCNEDDMGPEPESAVRTYERRDDLPFTVQVKRNLTCAEFRSLLKRDQSFLHYIGHTDADGVACRDGRLDLSRVDDVGVDAFLLNACRSYEQGMALVNAGAIGGAVTIEDVVNEGAVEVGRTVARLLNRGFPLRAAIEIVRDKAVMGGRYIVVGNGGLSITQPPTGVPILADINSTGDTDEYRVTLYAYPTDSKGIGSIYKPFIGKQDRFYLTGGEVDSFHVSGDELDRFLSLDAFPVRIGGRFHWSDRIDIAAL
jgi:hypothetical protein